MRGSQARGLNRLKTVPGHLDAVIAVVDDERHCPDVMKQVSALQSSLEEVIASCYRIRLRPVCLRRSRGAHRGDRRRIDGGAPLLRPP
ncbi:MAG: metal-sensing transcriptional repressor [Acidimicrobiia bacterium]